MNTSTQLKALIRNISKVKGISAQVLLRNYMFERLLERISVSKFRHNFILKGGMLIASIVGIDTRSTMDMDVTVKGLPVTEKTIKDIFDEIVSLNINDGVNITINRIDHIRDEADYRGFKVSLNTSFDGIKQTLKIDITTGDTITPCEVGHKFSLMFEERTIDVLAYNLETVFAEKLETIISRGTTNTRMRDFYDIYILKKLQSKNIEQRQILEAINRTFANRGTANLLNDKNLIISEIKESKIMQDLWSDYQKAYNYAAGVLWNEVLNAVETILSIQKNS
jgi:predicted nucleotidyltransferase component of viral defense system